MTYHWWCRVEILVNVEYRWTDCTCLWAELVSILVVAIITYWTKVKLHLNLSSKGFLPEMAVKFWAFCDHGNYWAKERNGILDDGWLIRMLSRFLQSPKEDVEARKAGNCGRESWDHFDARCTEKPIERCDLAICKRWTGIKQTNSQFKRYICLKREEAIVPRGETPINNQGAIKEK